MNKVFARKQKDIERMVRQIFDDKSIINVGLSGGRSIIPIIKSLMKVNLNRLKGLRFFLVDERLAANFNQTHLLKNGFKELLDIKKINKKQLFFPKITGNFNKDLEACNKIAKNNSLDLVFLGVGEDCHIASIFPKAKELESENLASLVIDSPKMPKERITLTLKAFENAKKVLIFFGKEKRKALKNYENNYKNKNYPASFIKGKNIIIITDIK